jgi:dihydroxyacetone kinase-like predicted kinase
MRTYLLEFVVTHPVATGCALHRQLRKTLPWAHELLVVGDRNALRVHVRTGHPDPAVGIGLACGVVADIVLKADSRSAEVAHPVC